MIVDVNVSLSRWPFRRLSGDDTPQLVEKLAEHKVQQAWVGSFDALLHRDMAAVNERLADECRRHGEGLLLPFGSVNLRLPDWEEDLRRCHEVHGMRGLRLHPNYHGYGLDDPEFARLLDLAGQRKLIVQLAVIMEDERTLHPLVRVPPVDAAPLVELLRARPELKVVLLNSFRNVRPELREKLLAAGQAYVEIATLEGVGGVGRLAETAPLERILFGSHFPLFYFESALLKLRESPLAGLQRQAIEAGNANKLLAG